MNIAEKLTTIAENLRRIFDAGYNQGYRAGYDDAYSEIGGSDEPDAVTSCGACGSTNLTTIETAIGTATCCSECPYIRCPNCGEWIVPGSPDCPNCGTYLGI